MSNLHGLAGVAVALLLPAIAQAQGLYTHSRTPYVHWINLLDEDGQMIDIADRDAPPYSPAMTCGKCHNVDSISHGWHFNANLGKADAGRPGEPWILTDGETRTQLPLSYRDWPGTFNPADINMSEWDFTARFGRHMPGGGPGMGPAPAADEAATDAETEADDDPFATPADRWHVTGYLENDCMMCHSADATYDVGEWARQIGSQNFKWAPTAAVGLGRVVGEARRVPDEFDPEFPEFTPGVTPPSVEYDKSKMDANNRVFFDIVRAPNVERCYYCHSTDQTDELSPERWHRDTDVHIAAGMNCADCHRHGIDHNMTRNFATEFRETQNASVAALSCAGCHLGDAGVELVTGQSPESTGNAPSLGGRLGAPIPEHKGIPPLHFQSLSCTACHSGPWPGESSQSVQTSLAHALGLGDEHRNNADPPHITEPVFVKNADGVIEPHRMVWPAYWGVLEGEVVRPLPLDEHRATIVAGLAMKDDAEDEAGDSQHYPRGFAPVTAAQIAAVLAGLQDELAEGQTAVYITGGKLHRLDGEKVVAAEHEAARPYSWPLAHDVRPAGQSLGVRSCMDCHAPDSPFVAGLVAAAPVSPTGEVVRTMYELQDRDPALWETWARGFALRTAFKFVAFTAAGLVALVLLWFVLQTISAVHDRKRNKAHETGA